MRTTLTLEPELAARLKELARRNRTSFKDAVNEVIRRGLRAPEREGAARFVVDPHDGGLLPGVDAARLNQLVDELEAEDHLREG